MWVLSDKCQTDYGRIRDYRFDVFHAHALGFMGTRSYKLYDKNGENTEFTAGRKKTPNGELNEIRKAINLS